MNIKLFIQLRFAFAYDILYPHKPSVQYLLTVLHYIRVIVSDTLYVLVNFVIDMFLYFFVRNQMRKKRTDLIAVSFLVVNSRNATLRQLRDEYRKKKQLKHSQNRITGMILLNGLNFCLFRLPAVILSLTILFFGFNQEMFRFYPYFVPDFAHRICKVFKLCDVLEDVSFIFYMISFIVQFVIFVKLDKNFKESYHLMKVSIRKRFCINKIEQ